MQKARSLRLERYVDTRLPIMRISNRNPISVNGNKRMDEIIDLYLDNIDKRRKIFVVSKNKLKGIVTGTDILSFLGAGPKYKEFTPKKLNTPVSKIMEKNIHFLDKNTSLEKALPIFRKDWFGTYPILQKNEFMGVVNQWDIIKSIEGSTGILVDDIMLKKPLFVREQFTLFDASKMMTRGAFNTLPVTHRGILTGFITPERVISYLKKTGNLENLRKLEINTDQAMDRNLHTVRIRDDIGQIVSIMNKMNLSSLPVIHADKVIGIINEKDIIDSLY